MGKKSSENNEKLSEMNMLSCCGYVVRVPCQALGGGGLTLHVPAEAKFPTHLTHRRTICLGTEWMQQCGGQLAPLSSGTRAWQETVGSSAVSEK